MLSCLQFRSLGCLMTVVSSSSIHLIAKVGKDSTLEKAVLVPSPMLKACSKIAAGFLVVEGLGRRYWSTAWCRYLVLMLSVEYLSSLTLGVTSDSLVLKQSLKISTEELVLCALLSRSLQCFHCCTVKWKVLKSWLKHKIYCFPENQIPVNKAKIKEQWA